MAMESTTLESAVRIDRKALVEIYERYNADLYRYAYRLLGDANQAEDCVSETFSRFLRVVRESKSPVEDVRAYLYRMAHNWITDQYRRQPLHPLLLDEDLHGDPAESPSHAFNEQFEREQVRAALLRLPPEQRQVIELRFLEDWPHEAVARALGKSSEATRALQHRALAALRRMLIEPELME
jgi:RNA polymerase sigma-70 factor, ECF subfamily